MKRYLKLLIFFLISILICLLFHKFVPDINTKKIQETLDKPTPFQNEVLLSKYKTDGKLTMFYLYPEVNKNKIETDILHQTFITNSSKYGEFLESKMININSEDGFYIYEYLNLDNKTESSLVLMDEKGYILSVYFNPVNKQQIDAELIYAINNLK